MKSTIAVVCATLVASCSGQSPGLQSPDRAPPHADFSAAMAPHRSGGDDVSSPNTEVARGVLDAWVGKRSVPRVIANRGTPVIVDLDGDGREEWVCAISEEGVWTLIVVGFDGRVREEKEHARPGPSNVIGMKAVVLGDLTGDRLPEVDVQISHNVMTTLVDTEHRILSGHGGSLRTISPAWGEGYARTVSSRHISGELVAIESTGLKMVDSLLTPAGYFQHCSVAWIWKEAAGHLALASRACDPPVSRREVLYEALWSHDQGQLDRARELFREVVDDPKLTERTGDAGSERAALSQVAAFRLVVLSLQRDGLTEAQRWAARLGGRPGRINLSGVAANVIAEWRSRKDQPGGSHALEACEEATSRIGADADLGLEQLSTDRFAPKLSIASLCPSPDS
jgi:hypothetical protein